MQGFSIGRMAELNCVSEKTLRLYHQKGLLDPIRVDETTGYRYYSYEQCSTIDMIQQLQSLGIALDEIKRLLDDHDPAGLACLLESQLAAIGGELLRLSIARQNALQLLGSYHAFRDKPLCDQVILEQMGERHTIRFAIFNPRSLELTDNAELFLREWEINLRLTKKHMLEAGIPLALFHRVGCRIAQEDLMRCDYRLASSFVFLDETALRLADEVETLPAGLYLTLYKDHYAEPDGRSAEVRGLDELLDFAAQHGFAIAGDYYGEIVAETPAFLYEGREMLFKLQVPVTAAR